MVSTRAYIKPATIRFHEKATKNFAYYRSIAISPQMSEVFPNKTLT